MKMPDALQLLGEADGLVRDHGFFSGRGRPPAGKRDRCVMPYLARKYGVTTRWIAKKLKEGRRQKQSKPLVKSVSYQAGLAAAFAGVRSLAPVAAAPHSHNTSIADERSPRDVLKGALLGFLKKPGPCTRETIELGKALFDELLKTTK